MSGTRKSLLLAHADVAACLAQESVIEEDSDIDGPDFEDVGVRESDESEEADKTWITHAAASPQPSTSFATSVIRI